MEKKTKVYPTLAAEVEFPLRFPPDTHTHTFKIYCLAKAFLYNLG